MEGRPRVGGDLEAVDGAGGVGPVAGLLGVGGAPAGQAGDNCRREDPVPSRQVVARAPGGGAIATPQGAFPTGMRPITLRVSVSTTVTSFEGPFAL